MSVDGFFLRSRAARAHRLDAGQTSVRGDPVSASLQLDDISGIRTSRTRQSYTSREIPQLPAQNLQRPQTYIAPSLRSHLRNGKRRVLIAVCIHKTRLCSHTLQRLYSPSVRPPTKTSYRKKMPRPSQRGHIIVGANDATLPVPTCSPDKMTRVPALHASNWSEKELSELSRAGT